MRSLTLRSLEGAARSFHALADETRLRIIDRLRDGDQCVCDLTGLLRTGQSRLSFHLKTLKEAGILTDRREGRWVYYSLNPTAFEELGEFIDSIKATSRGLRVASDCCE
jgi:ArsR family transcriptional regulator